MRAKHYGAASDDSNVAVTSALTILAEESNYVLVPSSVSQLSYPYWIARYEANVSGTLGADAITATEADLATCNYEFHENKDTFHSTCGTRVSTGYARSISGVEPTTATWHQAWTVCRNASTVGTVASTAAATSAGKLYNCQNIPPHFTALCLRDITSESSHQIAPDSASTGP